MRLEPLNRLIFLVENLILPAFKAYKVSSLPRLTLTPGSHLDPLCLMMILPAATFSPSKSFTPNRFECDSRPNRVEPAAFV
ncbi:MAG: hypothetical protein UV53_C0007G0011 [Candidatus Azambacteria bacterium GW2011_GWE1_42_9]|nr:MAG: hypothetical protein UV53_C0007G0011 [Candidatus Azambacteria bacterium GW2011_GWE1_42_9]KKT03342.1 MAG: hypothetical protein UV81_C0002G0095 [Candidatus Azambacteria bacterium GW2011_GWD1_43_18]KKT12268.1 MAG: hypothetical protein UV93_C0005G0023 [Candidatus Azambacteria bacterium GW2011_GWC2_43_27]